MLCPIFKEDKPVNTQSIIRSISHEGTNLESSVQVPAVSHDSVDGNQFDAANLPSLWYIKSYQVKKLFEQRTEQNKINNEKKSCSC